jgi:putative ABC transport system permease protein
MPAANALRQLYRDLKAQKLRTFLTTLGVVWGTVAVSLLLAFGQALHRQMMKNAAGLGRGIVIAFPSQTSIPFEGLGKGRRIRIDDADIRLVRQRSVLLGRISGEYSDTLTLKLGPRRLAVETSGVEPAWGEMRSMIPQAGGRFLNPLDEHLERRVAFLGNDLAKQLFGSADPVGKTFRLHNSPFLVVGVLKEKTQNSSYSGRDKDKVIIPASTFRALTGQKYVDEFIYTAADVTRTEDLTAEVLAIIAGQHRFDPKDKEAISIWDTTGFSKFFDTFMIAFKGFLIVVGALILLVGAIGVSNIMNVVVEERTPETGIKMALGARPRGILGQFLLESLVVTGLGGLLGLLISDGICRIFPALGLEQYIGLPTLSPGVASATAALLGFFGILAGYFPAKKAAELDPVVAMKM